MKTPVIAGLMTARGGSKSVLNKNLLDVDGDPIYLKNILLAKRSKLLGDIFVSTDIPEVIERAESCDYRAIVRPAELSRDDTPHYEVFRHALKIMEEARPVDLLVILLGNSLGAYGEDIDRGIQILLDDPQVDGVMSVSRFNMFNPFRAFSQDGSKDMHTCVPQDLIRDFQTRKPINDKNAFGDIYFFNGAFWVCRREKLIQNDGQLPWSWLGNKIRPVVQKDIMEIDAPWQVDVVKKVFALSPRPQ